jgi:putative two-component system response regulator
MARILLVDDEQAHRELLAELLAMEGHEVEKAGDGKQALDKAFRRAPDIVLMDVNMPMLSGLEACRRMKQDERTHLIPVVLITGLTAREDRIQGIAAGCDDFLTKPVDSEQLLARTRNLLRTKSLVDELEQAENVLVSLANALEALDPYTRGHSERVAVFATELGGAAGLSRGECRDLRRAGLLHDIGKIGIPVEYLRKPGKLTTEEYGVVKLHSAIGADICRPLRTMAPLLALIRGHHERVDGRGYPDGLAGAALPVGLRCLTIADVYDALTSDRSYRRAMAPDGALEVMREEAGAGMWDARLLDLFAEKVLPKL